MKRAGGGGGGDAGPDEDEPRAKRAVRPIRKLLESAPEEESNDEAENQINNSGEDAEECEAEAPKKKKKPSPRLVRKTTAAAAGGGGAKKKARRPVDSGDDDDDDDDDQDAGAGAGAGADEDEDEGDFELSVANGGSAGAGGGRGRGKQGAKGKAAASAAEPTYGDSDEDEDDGEGEVHEIGQIAKIEVENFMNHRKFTMNFGHNLNFITGRNGSGKSAIAGALQLCLGSSALATGRSTNLSHLIREGSPGPAVLRVTLRNEGDLAYEPERFGDRIIIERTITKTAAGHGGGGYKLLGTPKGNKGLPVVLNSAGKKELGVILQKFNIFVENPCCVLTQEESKKFIQGKEKEKYEFFYRATGLRDMQEANSEVMERLKMVLAKCEGFRETLTEKQTAYKKLKAEMEEISGFEKEELKIAAQQCKVYWLESSVSERVCDNLRQVVEDKQGELDDAEKNEGEMDRATKEAGDPIKLKEEIQEVNNSLSTINEEIDSKGLEIKAVAKRIVASDSRTRNTTDALRATNSRLKEVQNQIRSLRAKATGDSAEREKRLEQESADMANQVADLKAAEAEAREEIAKVTEEREELNAEKAASAGKTRNAEAYIEKLKREINDLSGSGGSSLKLFGSNVPRVLEQAATNSILGKSLKGPIGSLVRMKEGCEKYAGAIQHVLNPILNSFIVSNAQQRQEAMRTLRNNNSHKTQTVITQTPGPRYSNVPRLDGLPDGVISVLSALVIDDDQVFNAIIDQVRPEAAIIVPNDRTALDLSENSPRGGMRFKNPNVKRCVTIDGQYEFLWSAQGNRSNNNNWRGGKKPDIRLVRDLSEVIANKKNDLERSQADLAETKKSLPDLGQADRALTARQNNANATIRRCGENIKQHNRNKQAVDQQLREILEARNIDTTHEEAEEAELMAATATHEEMITTVSNETAELKNQQKELKREVDELETRKEQYDKRVAALQRKVASIVDEVQRNLQKAAKAKKATETKRKEVEEARAALEKEEAKHLAALEEAKRVTKERVRDWDGQPLKLTARETSKNNILKLAEALKEALEKSKCLAL